MRSKKAGPGQSDLFAVATARHHPVNVESPHSGNHRRSLARVMVPVRRSSLPPRLPDAFDRVPLR
jgi:hypothetical protein